MTDIANRFSDFCTVHDQFNSFIGSSCWSLALVIAMFLAHCLQVSQNSTNSHNKPELDWCQMFIISNFSLVYGMAVAMESQPMENLWRENHSKHESWNQQHSKKVTVIVTITAHSDHMPPLMIQVRWRFNVLTPISCPSCICCGWTKGCCCKGCKGCCTGSFQISSRSLKVAEIGHQTLAISFLLHHPHGELKACISRCCAIPS